MSKKTNYTLSIELESDDKESFVFDLERIISRIREGYLAGEGWDISEE